MLSEDIVPAATIAFISLKEFSYLYKFVLKGHKSSQELLI